MNSLRYVLMTTVAVAAVTAWTVEASAQESTSTEASAEATAESVGTTAEPDHTVSLEINGGVHYVTDSRFDAMSDGNAIPGGTTLLLSYGLDYVGAKGLRLFLLGQWGAQQSSRFNEDAELQWRHGLYMLGAEYGPWTFGTFRPFVRLGAGYSIQGLDLQSDAGAAMSDRAHDVAGLGTVGFQWLTPRGFMNLPFQLGLNGQVGYLTQTPADFDEMSASEDDDFARAALDLGELPRSGIYWDIGASLVFRW